MFSKKVTSIFSIDFAISHLARAEQGAPERIPTTNLLIRSQQTCPREFELQMRITRGEENSNWRRAGGDATRFRFYSRNLKGESQQNADDGAD